jgi:hypothetical protein
MGDENFEEEEVSLGLSPCALPPNSKATRATDTHRPAWYRCSSDQAQGMVVCRARCDS